MRYAGMCGVRAAVGRGGLLGSILIALIALTGCATTVPGSPEPRQNSAPFYLAVNTLLTQPVGHYAGTAADDSARWDLRATGAGESLGSIVQGGNRTDVLAAGGRTYAKPPANALPALPGGLTAQSVAGRWLTGTDGLTTGLPPGSWSPNTVGAALLNALDTTPEFPRIGGPTVPVGTDRALEVTTPLGVLDVSATAPYRVLQLKPAPEGHSVPAIARPTPTTDDPGAQIGPLPVDSSPLADGVGPIIFLPMSPADTDQAYSDLIAQTRTLTDAVDIGVNFDFDAAGGLSCDDNTSCTVTSHIGTTTTATRQARLSGTVTASMAATVTVNGRPAGGCDATGALPINGTGTLSCVDPGVAPVIAAIRAEQQAKANAQARIAGQNVTITWTLDYHAHVDIKALAGVQAEVDLWVASEQGEQRNTDNRASACTRNSFVAGTPVLMADGTTRPIETLTAGDEIRNATPGRTVPQTNRVTAVHRTDEDHDFVHLTIAAPDTTGVIDTTAGHRFYDTTTATWTEAATLTPGNHLQTPTATAEVRAVTPYTATTSTYNLSIADTPTFFVVANGIAVLVHNCSFAMVPYDSDELSRAAYKTRVTTNVPAEQNIGVAQVPGWNDPGTGDLVIGVGKDGEDGADDHILDQLKARGFGPDKITALYSDRQPCPDTCDPLSAQLLAGNIPITYAIPATDDPVQRGASTNLLKRLIELAGGPY
ncbi:nucleic acid/nucleotide deaminase domain-containing protein [Nocardia sp. alder85J]|uniref:nucleic acid/nucleotide deaminase domain-containing protein n=1 Tax=Nocardia sp. alder85J TaxID=2862949 RepID=UPI001CD5BE60|nr:nucleic acid/nucleotide deaminase domain-containing protein [Nocardia sp. alder85J]MCX4093057.1 polymorphic toxin-type HINT domain-containing protein [Nocardia sp. alder85J]